MELNRIYNEDCLEGMKRIPDKSIDMILADLPYGTTQNKWDSIIPLEPLWEQYERVIKENGAIVLTSAQPFTSVLAVSNLGLFRYDFAWDKKQITGFLNAKKMPLRQHENILVFYKRSPTYNPQFAFEEPYKIERNNKSENYGKQTANKTKSDGRRYPTSVLRIPQVRVKGGHPTQKPVALFEYLIKTYSNAGDTVLDNVMGSGTTAAACINTNRNFIGFELDETYYNIANERIGKSLERVIG